MGSAIIVAAITYGAGLLTLLVAVHVVVCVGTGLGSIPTVSYGATVRHRPDGLDAAVLGFNLKPYLLFSGTRC